ncbi:hypothetical protein GM3708_3534 (plasmid) [Geminocystis sp. NIES-3708]|nr:hypothetical protein GM3708_3534 [Geminocystis sp. NIES-3708]
MLGTTGAGKTCYILGLYSTMQLGLQGFSLSCQDMDDDLRLTEQWEQLVFAEEGEDRWPSATGNEPHNYVFDFNYALKHMMGFEWLDYRGGAMSDSQTESDVKILTTHLVESSCVFLCISGELLKQKLTESQLNIIARRAGVTRMNSYLAKLAQAKQPTNENPYPVVITITKYDQCFHRNKDEILEDIKNIFRIFFQPNSGWLTMICPVSLGKELAENKNTGEIEPKNMHLPLVFAIYCGYSNQLRQQENIAKSNRDNLNSLREGNFLDRWFNSEQIKSLEGTLYNNQEQIEGLKKQMRFLSQELTNANLYLSGTEMQLDV